LTRPPPSEEEVLQQNAPSSSLPDLAELDRLEQYKEGNFEETTAASNQIDVTTSTGSENGGIGT
jgi:antirestriction protein